MMTINWQDLRPWNGSQHNAFEELCCQLARHERADEGSTFIRKAPPDAGVECYWKLPDGDEWGWQAKFFGSPPGHTQWRQLDDSVKKALEKHPRLTKYTICLPIDRQDPRDQKTWFMDKWQQRVCKWRNWAEERSMSVQFVYWGSSEVLDMLTTDEHRGRYYFWFNKELFSQPWFATHLDEAIANVGVRYTPELDVELPVARVFEGLGRTAAFYTRIKTLYGDIRRTLSKVRSAETEEVAKAKFDSLGENAKQLLSILENVKEVEQGYIAWDSAVALASESWDCAIECMRSLEAVIEQQRENRKAAGKKQTLRTEEHYSSAHYRLRELIVKLDEFREFAQSNGALLANVGALLLVGDAGVGKTHLFCDVAKQRIEVGLPTVLLLGQHFRDREPWAQIIELLGLECSREEFLGALEAAAQACGRRPLILVDALNEGKGKVLWEKHLAGMLGTLSNYPWLGIAVSVRTSYEDAVIPEGLGPERLVRVEHHGFAGHEYQATRTFFDHFGIERPSIPLLHPEFSNPLFLKLFCQALKNQGLTRVPPGLKGITAIFAFFIESINKKLSKAQRLNFDPKSRVVQEAVERLAEVMADKGSTWLPRQEAQGDVDWFLPGRRFEQSLFRHLISEGLLTEDRFRRGDEWCEGIHFSYQRFTDHLIAKCLLDKHLDPSSPVCSFAPDQPLGSLVKDEQACWRNRGLVGAFTVQLPERTNKELLEVAPRCVEYRPALEGFIESLIWRSPGAITEATLTFVNEHVIGYEDTHDQFLNALLTVAAMPDHPYNADFLHRNLKKFELAKRDAWWSIFLHCQHGNQGAVDRLVDWAWSPEDKSHIEDESIRLCGTALTWFLTTSNRYLRDRATKALVCLLTPRIHILERIISDFFDVNDPYVLERLYAVAYGCAMRTTNREVLAELAGRAYELVFKSGEPVPDILLRDYARGVIEVALGRGCELNIDTEKTRPPYKSEWPSGIPTGDELKRYGEWQEGMPREEWARGALYHSVMDEHSDFANYVIGASCSQWSNFRFAEPGKPSPRDLYETFIRSLTSRQRKSWERYQSVGSKVELCRRFDGETQMEVFRRVFTDEELEKSIADAEQALRKTLGKNKTKLLDGHVIPYLNEVGHYKGEPPFDLSVARRWIMQRVLALGWTSERFGHFDMNINRGFYYGRGENKPERIGKKYQWIAYHEFLARVSDNFEFGGGRFRDRREQYEGPWQLIHVRDIDPSCLLGKAQRGALRPSPNIWWGKPRYEAWDLEAEDVVWLKRCGDLPPAEQYLLAANPEDMSTWLLLETVLSWEEPTPPQEERFERPRRELFYLVRSYIAKKDDLEELYDWAKRQHFWGRWMPESTDLFTVFLGEFPLLPAYTYHCTPQYGYVEWTRGIKDDIPKEVLVTAERYVWEHGTYDCSIDETVGIYLPCKWLADNMQLRWDGIDGRFFDPAGSLTAFDPSVVTAGPSALLVRKEPFLEFLDANGFGIFWTVVGEKQLIGGPISPDKWKGRLQISGAYTICQGEFRREVHTKFVR